VTPHELARQKAVSAVTEHLEEFTRQVRSGRMVNVPLAATRLFDASLGVYRCTLDPPRAPQSGRRWSYAAIAAACLIAAFWLMGHIR
jgi:hypothetical protein